MDLDDEMFEEHLDEEYQTSEIEEQFAELETQIADIEQKQMTANMAKEHQEKLEKAIALLRLHVQSYQRIIILNRRRAKQRLRRRQCTLRNFFLQSLMEMQIRFVEMLPLTIDPQVCVEETKDEEDAVTYYRDIISKFTNDQWLDTFHISKHVFNQICTRLKSSMENEDMHFESWIAMCIYMLATGSKFSFVSMLFDVEIKFVRRSLFKFIEKLLKTFSKNLLTMPKTKTEFEKISKGFQETSYVKTPCIVGVLCVFELPNKCVSLTCNTCSTESLKVQICIDNHLLIRKVETTTKKPSMFLKSPNEICHNWMNFTDDMLGTYYIATPSGYPVRTWLLQKNDNPNEAYNRALNGLNILREIALKKLFGRWQILNTTECILPESKDFIVKGCSLLHNLLEESGEYFSAEWCTNFDPFKIEYKLNEAVTNTNNNSVPITENSYD